MQVYPIFMSRKSRKTTSQPSSSSDDQPRLNEGRNPIITLESEELVIQSSQQEKSDDLPDSLTLAKQRFLENETVKTLDKLLIDEEYLLKELQNGISLIRKLSKTFDKETKSLARAKQKFEDGTPPRNLVPNVTLVLPDGCHPNMEEIEKARKEFGLSMLRFIIDARQKHVDQLEAQLKDTTKIFEDAKNSYLANGGEIRQKTIMDFTNLNLKLWWDRQIERLFADLEAERVRVKKREQERSRLAEEAKTALEENSPEELVQDLVEEKVEERVQKLDNQLKEVKQSLAALTKEIKNLKAVPAAKKKSKNESRPPPNRKKKLRNVKKQSRHPRNAVVNKDSDEILERGSDPDEEDFILNNKKKVKKTTVATTKQRIPLQRSSSTSAIRSTGRRRLQRSLSSEAERHGRGSGNNTNNNRRRRSPLNSRSLTPPPPRRF